MHTSLSPTYTSFRGPLGDRTPRRAARAAERMISVRVQFRGQG